MQYDRTVIGYHGCDRDVAERILLDPTGNAFRESTNDYDWLGKGIYFWEYGLDRALQWAQQQYPNNPGVVGALIQLGNCFDLMDTRFTTELGQAATSYVNALLARGQTIPKNVGSGLGARRFDCAVINVYLQDLADEGITYDTVRCGFTEGDPTYVNQALGIRMGIYQQSHIQLAVRNPQCIIGTFRPRLADPTR
ncbi:MAG: hypothetical protein AAFX40_19300 [Cyanobacteria bacterium J06639_1]